MEFQEFVKQRKRMCRYYTSSRTCHNENGNVCPLFDVMAKTVSCTGFCLQNSEEAETIVADWVKEHPIMTNRKKIKEMFGVNIDDSPSSGCSGIKCPGKFIVNCKDCPYRNFWDQEYKEINS